MVLSRGSGAKDIGIGGQMEAPSLSVRLSIRITLTFLHDSEETHAIEVKHTFLWMLMSNTESS